MPFMQKLQPIDTRRAKETGSKISHLSLHGLLPVGYTLALNQETRTLSLLSDGPMLIAEQQFSENELRLIVPILESFPHYCPYEVLLAHLSSNTVTPVTLSRFRRLLEEAQMNGTWQQELRPVRRAISSLRGKLNTFNLSISNIREKGCSLTSLLTK
jgi:hypothetical protein